MSKFSVLDLLELPPQQLQVYTHLSRSGPASLEGLAADLAMDPLALQQVVAHLVASGRIESIGAERYDVVMGHVSRRTILPDRFWPALLAGDRQYSKKEIVVLQTAVPILQFARGRLAEFSDHGPSHAFRVKGFATQLGTLLALTSLERRCLRAAALFHDVGNAVDREQHHLISEQTVVKLAAMGKLPYSEQEAALVGLVCRWHRREYDPARVDWLDDEPVRTGLLASILRVADAMDIDQRRSDYGKRFRAVLEFFYSDHMQYWTSLEEILGVRVRCGGSAETGMCLQVFTRQPATDPSARSEVTVPGNMQIAMLRKDLRSTPFDWQVKELVASAEGRDAPVRSDGDGETALLVFPLEAHSLVMAALSRKHLRAAGYEVALLCYPDTPDSGRWLWGEALPGVTPTGYARLVVIGDRPGADEASVVAEIGRWRAAQAAVSLLNRHEATWSRLPHLLALGVDVVLGSDWAYFWGDAPDPFDLTWGALASLCTRDPNLPSATVCPDEQAIAHGLLATVFSSLRHSKGIENTAAWAALAKPIMERIADDDRGAFIAQAVEFAAVVELTARVPGRVEGQVVLFEELRPVEHAGVYFWALERAIECQGRTLERGLHFNTPYAIATWPEDASGDRVVLLAISHWREEEAIPIRLLFPVDISPPPEGNESSLTVRLPAASVGAVVQALVTACNHQEDLL